MNARSMAVARLCALFLVLPAGAAAQDAPRDIGPWTVSASSDRQGCFLTRTYSAPRRTTMLFGLDADGANRLTILNANWSIAERERMKLDFRLSGAAFPRHLAVGIEADGKKGFVAGFGSAFPRTFATSAFLHVRRGDVPVEELRLDGSGAAVAELRRCVAGLGKAAAVENADHIPIDPFAQKKKRESRK